MNNILGPGEIPVFPQQIENVTKAIEQNQLVTGPHLEELEELLSSLFDFKYVVLTSNGFSALFSLLRVLKDSYSKVVTIPTSTCFAFINASKASNYPISFVDSLPNSIDLDLRENKSETGQNNIILCPNHFGLTTEINHKMVSNEEFILEDAAQSFLSRKNINSNSDALILSFYPTKSVNGINGGAVLTNQKDVYKNLIKSVAYTDQFQPEDEARYNLSMNNLNAAFLLGSLENIDVLESNLLKNYGVLKSICEGQSLQFLPIKKGEVPLKFIINEEIEIIKSVLSASKKTKKVKASAELLWLCDKDLRNKFINTGNFVSRTVSLPLKPFMNQKDFEDIEMLLKQI